jgi:hypothetical protein
VTVLFLIGLVLLIAGYDLLTWQKRGIQSTISWTLRQWDINFPFFRYLVAFALGALFGHLFL